LTDREKHTKAHAFRNFNYSDPHFKAEREKEREREQRIDFSGFCHTLAENKYFIFKNKQPDY
jgi:hypothetical protein